MAPPAGQGSQCLPAPSPASLMWHLALQTAPFSPDSSLDFLTPASVDFSPLLWRSLLSSLIPPSAPECLSERSPGSFQRDVFVRTCHLHPREGAVGLDCWCPRGPALSSHLPCPEAAAAPFGLRVIDSSSHRHLGIQLRGQYLMASGTGVRILPRTWPCDGDRDESAWPRAPRGEPAVGRGGHSHDAGQWGRLPCCYGSSRRKTSIYHQGEASSRLDSLAGR